MREKIEEVYRAESRKVLATPNRLLGDFDLAQESLHDASLAALEQWERDGIPANPSAWMKPFALDIVMTRRSSNGRSIWSLK